MLFAEKAVAKTSDVALSVIFCDYASIRKNRFIPENPGRLIFLPAALPPARLKKMRRGRLRVHADEKLDAGKKNAGEFG